MAVLLLGVALWQAGGSARAQAPGADREYLIKAAFLYQFSNYIEWPTQAFQGDGDPFVIGVYRENPFGEALDKIARKKKVGKRPISVSVIDSPEHASQCHMLFLPGDVSEDDLSRVVRTASGRDVLIIGESSRFIELGGDVQFFLDSNKVRFAFREDAAGDPNLKVSSKLLALAKPVPAPSGSDVAAGP